METLSSQVIEFEGKARANPIGAPFRCFLMGKLLVLPTIFRIDWKVIAGTNTLAYLTSLTVTKDKCFVTLTPGKLELKMEKHI